MCECMCMMAVEDVGWDEAMEVWRRALGYDRCVV